MTRARILVVCGLLAALAWPFAAAADERILSFRSAIEIGADGGMDVTETIRVRAEGHRIRHGIYRDFPTDYRDRLGNAVRVAFEPRALMRDGGTEPFHTERRSNGVRVYFGAENTTLEPGEYTWSFTYRTNRQLGFFADHDELYWNATGNGWDFPIDEAGATVTLPGRVAAGDLAVEAYTGPRGAKGRDYVARADAPSHATFRTTRTLAPREGLTIVVGFPKGLVAEPSVAERQRWFLHDNAPALVLGLGLLLLLAFYLVQWRRVGRDPRPGTIIPRYEPPDGFAPGALRYVERMGFDDRCIAADVVDLAVRGHLRIVQEGRRYRVERRTASAGATPPTPDEAALLDDLFRGGATLVFEQSEHRRIGAALNAHRQRYCKAYEGSHFRRHTGIVVAGVLFTIATLAGAALLLRGDGRVVAGFMMLWLSVWSVGVIALCSAAIGAWRSGGKGRGLFLSLFALPFVLGELGGIAVLVVSAGFLFGFGVFALVALNLLFRHLIRSPTALGRERLDEIAGLRLYLTVAERDEIAAQKAPPLTSDRFHRLLPYALALGVERNWTDRFAATVGAAAAAAATAAAGWYSGGDFSRAGLGGFASGLGSAFGSAISSSSSAPGSSSGGGGGGSSGGGGGGGGGGGW